MFCKYLVEINEGVKSARKTFLLWKKKKETWTEGRLCPFWRWYKVSFCRKLLAGPSAFQQPLNHILTSKHRPTFPGMQQTTHCALSFSYATESELFELINTFPGNAVTPWLMCDLREKRLTLGFEMKPNGGKIRSVQNSWDVKRKTQNITGSFANCFSNSKQSSGGYRLFFPMQQCCINFSIN